jgi:hypothetical protein
MESWNNEKNIPENQTGKAEDLRTGTLAINNINNHI